MRPLRLELEGFTSFREKVELDFDGLDLFAITGPTGAGKSSLIDALTFALYGQVPRVGREYKQLMSHGVERLSVRLDFEVGAQRFRIARTARVKGQPQVRLERLDGELAEPIADRVTEIEAHVVRIVGLDYEAFTRSVVLPQGQFDLFLKGKPEERRKILVALLNLGIYEDMQRIANGRAAEARREAEYIARQLELDFKGVTPEARAAREADLQEARAEATALGEQQQRLQAGLEQAQALRAARRDLLALAEELGREATRQREAEAALQAAAKQRERLEERRRDSQSRLKQAAFDPDRHVVLSAARPRAELLARGAGRLEQAAGKRGQAEQLLSQRREAQQRAEARLPSLRQAAEQAAAALRTARDEHAELRLHHAAHALRPQLTAGQPCPVCEQTVKKLPGGKPLPALKQAAAAEQAAEKAAERSRAAQEEALRVLERLAAERAGLEREHDQLAVQERDEQAQQEALRRELAKAGFDPAALAAPAALVERLARELAALEKAKQERERLENEERGLESARVELEQRAAVAQAQADEARRRQAEVSARRQQAEATAGEAEAALRGLAQTEGWDLPADARAGGDEVQALEQRRVALQRQAETTAARIARLETELKQLAEHLARAGELLARKQQLEADASLAASLATALRADQFIAFVQEEALLVLAQDGSRHLETLSQGRYSLAWDSQEFAVLDHWNADTQRSVKTLSGGETFLASLALALALAESLARLSAEGRAAEALDSLFLDEGFGSLDADTLDAVVEALDALHGGRRTVGVVTHIQELAERLPARVEVRRGEKSASLRVL